MLAVAWRGGVAPPQSDGLLRRNRRRLHPDCNIGTAFTWPGPGRTAICLHALPMSIAGVAPAVVVVGGRWRANGGRWASTGLGGVAWPRDLRALAI
jgi:hypothetical protein